MRAVSVYIEARGTAEKIFLVAKLVPVFCCCFFVPMTSRRVYTSVRGCNEVHREQPDPAVIRQVS